MSVYRVIRIAPDGSEDTVLNGVTRRPASWPSRAAAQAWVDYWSRPRFADSSNFRIEEDQCAAPSNH
jgi:hypothetical protein